MNVAGRMILRVIVAILPGMFAIGHSTADAQSQYRKTWEFNVQDGTVAIGLVTPTDFQSRPLPPTLDISYRGEPHPSLAEEVGFLREVLHDLPAIGKDPHTISAIYLPGPAEPEVKRRLAVAALHSDEWHNLITKGSGNAELILEHLLNSLRVYEAFNAALAEYGLRVKAVGAEKASAAKCLDLKIPDLPCSIHHNPRVPTGANLSVVLESTR